MVVKIFETPRTYTLAEYEVLVTFDEGASLDRVRANKDSMTHTDILVTSTDLPQIKMFDEELARQLARSTADYVIRYVNETNFSSKNDTFLDKSRDLLTMLRSGTEDYYAYERTFGKLVQQTLYQMLDVDNLEQSSFLLKDEDIVKTLLEIESNLLMGCEWLELSEQYSTWTADEEIGYVTNSIRTVLVNFEELYSKVILGEGTQFMMDLEAFKIQISKYSRLQNNLEDKELSDL